MKRLTATALGILAEILFSAALILMGFLVAAAFMGV
jgi:hypothetical protein